MQALKQGSLLGATVLRGRRRGWAAGASRTVTASSGQAGPLRVATGRSNQEIADALVISPAPVRTHVGRAMTKLGARDRTQLALHGVRAGLTIGDGFRRPTSSET
jgi:hypothetical protein